MEKKIWTNPIISNLSIKETLDKLDIPTNAWCINQPNKGPANGKDNVCRHANAIQTIQGTNIIEPYYCPYVEIHSQVSGVDRQCKLNNIKLS